MSKLLAKNPSNIFMGAKKQLVRVGDEWKEGKQIWEKVGTSWIKRWESFIGYDLFRIKIGKFGASSTFYGFNFNNTPYAPPRMTLAINGGTSTLGIPGDERQIKDGKIPCSLGGLISRFIVTGGPYSGDYGCIVIERDSNGVLPDFSEYHEISYRYGHQIKGYQYGYIKDIVEDPQGNWVSLILDCWADNDMFADGRNIANGNLSNAYSPFELMWGPGTDVRLPRPFDPGRIKCEENSAGGGGFNAMTTTPWGGSPSAPTFGMLNVEPITYGQTSYTVERLMYGNVYGDIELILKGASTINFLSSHDQSIWVFGVRYPLGQRAVIDGPSYVRILFKSYLLWQALTDITGPGTGPTPIHFDFKLTGSM